jgi:hypothetical protein
MILRELVMFTNLHKGVFNQPEINHLSIQKVITISKESSGEYQQ